MLRKKHCYGDCDFKSYYLNQAGRGFDDIRIFQGHPYQRGYGLGSLFKRYGIPLVKFLGKHLFNTGVSIGTDILLNDKPYDKETVKNHLKQGLRDAAKDGLTRVSQHGTGRKRYKKKAYKQRKTKKSKKDIFNGVSTSFIGSRHKI